VRDHLSSQRWLRSAAGGGVAKSFSVSTAFPFVAILFATSIVLVLGSPEAAPAQPRALIGGHMISTVGLPVVRICGPAVCAAALAVGLAMVAMHLTGTFHPPAGIDPLGSRNKQIVVIPVRAGRYRRAVADAFRICLAQSRCARSQQEQHLAHQMVVAIALRVRTWSRKRRPAAHPDCSCSGKGTSTASDQSIPIYEGMT